MADKFDFEKIVDGVINTAKNIGETIVEKSGEFIKDSGLQDLKDYYPFYNNPPLNLYLSEDKSLIFEFGLPGFIKSDINIEFEDDYMIFSAVLSNLYSTGGDNRYFKKKVKLGNIEKQKYYVPAERFNREECDIKMKNGLLRVVIPAVEGMELVPKE